MLQKRVRTAETLERLPLFSPPRMPAYNGSLQAARQRRPGYWTCDDLEAAQCFANRPNRLEPRQRKRRPKPYDLMTKPRPQARRQEAKTR